MKTNSLQFKVLLIVAVGMSVALAVSLASLMRVYGTIQELDRITRESFESQQAILRATLSFKTQVQEWKDVLIRGKDGALLDKHWKGFEKSERESDDGAKEARSATADPAVRAKIEAYLAAHKAAGEKYRQALAAFKAAGGDPAAGDRVVQGLDRGATELLIDAERLASEVTAKETLVAVNRADSAYRVAIIATIATMALALVFLWFFVRRAVLAPIGVAVGFAERIAQGDLTAEIQARSNDETGHLLRSLSIMNVGLADVVSQVRSSAESVVSAANQVAAGTTDLSQRTEEQASSLEETAASMEELASTVRLNAENARMADELARTASKRAEQGGAEVVHVVTTMTDISESARRIGDIISVIDGIAFQTNILALNAAVEAARAGEQGRGFAVVASEVRSLAQRSAQAAKEIKGLIGASLGKVETGTKLVEQAGDTIQALVIDVKRVSELMASIAEASSEQSRGVQQVNKTVTEMDKVVQQNASAVQQSAAAAEGMRRQAEALVQAVSTFRLRGAEGIAASVRPSGGGEEPARPAAFAPAPARPARALPAEATTADDDWQQF